MVRPDIPQFPIDLPMLSEQFQILNQKLQQRDQIIREGRRSKRKLFGLLPGWRPVGDQERYQELDALISEARQILPILHSYLEAYQGFFIQLRLHVRAAMTEACRQLLAAEGDRLQLEKELRRNSDLDLRSEIQSQQSHLRDSIQALGQIAFLLLAQADRISQNLEKLASIKQLQSETLDYLLHYPHAPIQAGAEGIPKLDILIQSGLEPLQTTLTQMVKLDRDLLRSVAEIQAMAQKLGSAPSGSESRLSESEDQLLASLLRSPISRDDWVTALKQVQAGSISLYFDLQQQLTAQQTSDQISIQNAIEALQIFFQIRLGPEDSSPSFRSYTTEIDYGPLVQLLQEENWKEADQLTLQLMCEAVDRGEEGWLREADIDRLPREDLRLIDHLWVHHSQGQLGFSIQKQIWQTCGSPGPEYQKYRSNWIEFGQRIHWQGGTAYDGWRYQRELEMIFPQKYPGHLPSCIGCNVGGGWGGWWVWGSLLAGILLAREEL